MVERKKNRCEEFAHSFPYTTDLDYVTLKTKWLLLCRLFLIAEYRTIMESV
jgi:hypothetical protein